MFSLRLAGQREEKGDDGAPPPREVEEVYLKYVIPAELPKRLLPRREVDQKIELEPGANAGGLAYVPASATRKCLSENSRSCQSLRVDSSLMRNYIGDTHLMERRLTSRLNQLIHYL